MYDYKKINKDIKNTKILKLLIMNNLLNNYIKIILL